MLVIEVVEVVVCDVEVVVVVVLPAPIVSVLVAVSVWELVRTGLVMVLVPVVLLEVNEARVDVPEEEIVISGAIVVVPVI